VRLAARGSRDLDAGEETIHHSAERDVVRRQGRRVHVRALIAGVALTALSVALAAAI
jgi:hypothetical protein